MEKYSVNIIGLSAKAHTFDYQFGNEFFEKYGTELLQGGDFEAKVVLDKHDTFIDADFSISGVARLTCDRSLEPFDEPVSLQRRVMFKYGEEAGELTDEIVVIPRDTATLELGQLMYEFIGLEIPIKRLHPRFRNEAEQGGEGNIIYSSGDENNDVIDPRWEKLKKLK